MASKSDIEHWHIDATIYDDRVEEIHFVTDPERNIRRKRQTVVWHFEKLLGRGGFGEVRLEKNRKNEAVRAVKKIATGATLSNNECEKELKAFLEFSKPKYREAAVFVEFIGWFKDSFNVYLAMEYIALGDLDRNVAACSGKLAESETQDITRQILSGLEIMHAESFAHRDLKPQNVLVVHGPPQWWVKIADFGVSKRLTESTEYHTKSGTQPYMAPEVLDYLDSETSRAGYTNAVDIWAVGCITYRLITGIVPFPSGKSLVKYCQDRSFFPSDALLNSRVGNTCFNFIEKLLATCPEERPSASQALRDTWIIPASDDGEPSEHIMNPNSVASELSRLTTSAIAYNTTSHDGLKSHSPTSPSHSDSRHAESSTPIRSSPNTTQSNSGLAAKDDQGRVLVVDYKDTLSATQHIGNLLFNQGRYSAAEREYQRAAKGRERVLGLDHEETLAVIQDLGDSLFCQQKYTAAERAYQRAADGRERVLGKCHQDTLYSFQSLGSSLFNHQKYSAAEQAYQRAADGREQLLGNDHQDTLDSIYWVGRSLFNQEKYSAAEKAHRRAADGQERVLGIGHIATLESIYWLGQSLHHQGKHSAAEQEYRRIASFGKEEEKYEEDEEEDKGREEGSY